MPPHVYQNPPHRWTLAAFLTAWVVGKSILRGMGLAQNPLDGVIILWLLFLARGGLEAQRLILAGPVLRFRQGFTEKAVPLAMAEVKLLRRGWQIRWRRGSIASRQFFTTSEAFRDRVIQAVAAARQAEPGRVPRTEQEATLAVPFFHRTERRRYQTGLLLFSAAAVAAAAWLGQPLLLLSLPIFYLVAGRLLAGTAIILLDGVLHFMGEGGPVHQVPLDRLLAVEPVGERRVRLELSDVRFPTLDLIRLSFGVDALVPLRRASAGEPWFEPGPAPTQPQEVGVARPEGVRCTLCGQPGPDRPQPGLLYVCERCEQRARFEADEAGHGLTGKEQKPI